MGDERAGSVHIGQVVERTSLSHRTLRHYDDVGLVTPSGRSEGGYRLYTDQDVARLLLIRRMKPLGYTIDEMKDLLETVGSLADTEAARAALDGFVADARSRRAKLAEQLAMADEFIDLLLAR
ncbi:MAG: MerR family transcriptional regulator [Acidobacteria bacterium]|nr:MerR family transcriptional regulator [Acidobacteriota bacterium]